MSVAAWSLCLEETIGADLDFGTVASLQFKTVGGESLRRDFSSVLRRGISADSGPWSRTPCGSCIALSLVWLASGAYTKQPRSSAWQTQLTKAQVL